MMNAIERIMRAAPVIPVLVTDDGVEILTRLPGDDNDL